MNGIVSVIVPVYNAERYLQRCIDSIRRQSYPHLEIVLVDDGSSDSSPAICDAAAREDARVRVLHQKNSGVSQARNNGISVSKGEWIAFCDNDDYMYPKMIETLLGMCLDNGCDIACSRPEKGSAESFGQSPHLPPSDVRVYSREEMLSDIYRLSSCYVWDKLYARRVFDSVRFPAGSYTGEDVTVLHRLFYAAERIAVTETRMYYHYIHGGSVMHRGFDVRWTEIMLAVKDRMEFAREHSLVPMYEQSVRKMVYYLGYLLYMNARYNTDKKSEREFSCRYKAMQRDYYRLAVALPSTSAGQRLYLWADTYVPFAYHLYNFVKWRIVRRNKDAVWGSIR